MKKRLLLVAVPLALTIGTPAAAKPADQPAPISEGTFRTWSEATPAVTYDTAVVPQGATAKLTVQNTGSAMRVRLQATGLVPGRTYGAHVHVNPCTDKPAEAGPHYQHRIDPAADPQHPSVDPDYANPRNEVWLDFTANSAGNGYAASVLRWQFSESRPAWSLVLHSERTHTKPGEAGMAGARVACLTRTALPAYENAPGRG
ncbi:superoxide dismutase family protein [Actinoplanes sp. NPDC024001]|uniref:superoxide dismutase family protein n=1 Tax=Actinoplanes sp. NPDC024001 TaxID=3154598 RepID=UPI0033D073F5